MAASATTAPRRAAAASNDRIRALRLELVVVVMVVSFGVATSPTAPAVAIGRVRDDR
jgi:hypothetical protein